MRLAKTENNIFLAFFLAYFDNLRVANDHGQKVERISLADRNRASAHKPKERVFLKHDLRTVDVAS